jgi:predicted ATPase
LEIFDHIELNEDEIEEALRTARENKHYKLVAEEYKRKISETPRFPSFSWLQLNDHFKKVYEVDLHNESIVEQICKYFAGDPEFNGDLNKGLFLMGGVGVGKTTILTLFSKNQKMSYKVVSCRDVERHFADQGD